MYTFLHVDAIGANTGLAGIAVFANDGTLDCFIDICIIDKAARKKDALDEAGRLAAESGRLVGIERRLKVLSNFLWAM